MSITLQQRIFQTGNVKGSVTIIYILYVGSVPSKADSSLVFNYPLTSILYNLVCILFLQHRCNVRSINNCNLTKSIKPSRCYTIRFPIETWHTKVAGKQITSTSFLTTLFNIPKSITNIYLVSHSLSISYVVMLYVQVGITWPEELIVNLRSFLSSIFFCNLNFYAIIYIICTRLFFLKITSSYQIIFFFINHAGLYHHVCLYDFIKWTGIKLINIPASIFRFALHTHTSS